MKKQKNDKKKKKNSGHKLSHVSKALERYVRHNVLLVLELEDFFV